jgi:hypothetical protein
MKWGLDCIGLVKPTTIYTNNQYIIIATYYIIKWVEAKAL